MGTQLGPPSRPDEIVDSFGQVELVKIIFRHHESAAGACVHYPARREAQKLLVLENVGVLVPVVFAPDPAVADYQGGRVADAAACEKGQGVLVEWGYRDGVLDPGVPVEDVRDVVIIRRAALRHDHHLPVSCRLPT